MKLLNTLTFLMLVNITIVAWPAIWFFWRDLYWSLN